jgi:hypothetical protein
LAKAGVACSAIRHQLRIDLWQRFAGASRLRRALHDGVDAVHPQACPLASSASSEPRTLAGGRDLAARPLIAGCHGTKRYAQPDTEHAERADRDHVAHHHRSGLKWIRRSHPLSRKPTQWFMSIAQVAECMQSAIGRRHDRPCGRIASTSWRPTGRFPGRLQSVRLSGCGAGPSASRAAPRIAGELPRPAKPRSPSGARTPGSGFRLARPPAGHDGTGHARCHRQSIRQGASIEDRNSSRETASGAIVVGHVSVKNVRTQ